jgi:hypothetical protein
LIDTVVAERGADAATLVAAILAGTAHHLITRLAHTQVRGARDVMGNADAAALWATSRALDAKYCRARVVINRQADSRAVRAAGGGIATVVRIVDALESLGTWETGQSAAHAARLGVADDRGAASTQRRTDSTAWIAAILACSAPIASARFARRWPRRTELARAALS